MEINKMPEVLNDFRIYDENSDTLYGVAKLELPDFKSITATIKGVGVGGEIEAPVLGQFESMETKLTHNINDKWNLTMVGGKAVALEARAANQYWDSANNKLCHGKGTCRHSWQNKTDVRRFLGTGIYNRC